MNNYNDFSVPIVPDSAGTIGILQITDMHLFADKTKKLLGIDTNESYHAVVKHAMKYVGQCAAVLCTGDLSQDQSSQSYSVFSERIKMLEMPCYWLPGNHDKQSVMLPSLLQEGWAHTKQIMTEHWQIILLDSQVEGVPYGYLSQAQLDFLEKKLQAHPEKFTLIGLHHHVLPVGSAWLDQHILKNNQALLALTKRYSNVKVVLSGHVHQDFDVMENDVRFLASPSTSVQFKPVSNDFAVDEKSPGYRHLQLHQNGSITTNVERITADLFTCDADAAGY